MKKSKPRLVKKPAKIRVRKPNKPNPPPPPEDINVTTGKPKGWWEYLFGSGKW